MRAGTAQCLTAPAVKLSEEVNTNTERTINNPFILFEKTIVKYTDTQSSSLQPFKIKVRLYYYVAYFENNNL